MSKLSFRARALDASKPMPIYLAEELPDLPDYSAINRAVPQMPSGMEKEEESEHHLQRAISGSGLIIPTPEVCSVSDLHFYERCYPPDYKMPKQHIHMQPLWEEQEAPEYDMDSEDERWLRHQRHPDLTELLFEQMMDRLEKSSGQTVVTLSEAKLLLQRADDLVIAVYDYWLNKRLTLQHPLILSVKTESRPGQSSNNPYLAFRRRTEKMQTRKNRKNDESSYEKMLKLRRELARALALLQLVARREQAKRELVALTGALAERRHRARDYSEPEPAPHRRSVFAPTTFRREPLAVQQFAPPVDSRQREKRPYKRRKHRHHLAGTPPPARDASSSSDDSRDDPGPFAFRRKQGCYYQLPTSTLCGDPVPGADLFEHELDPRHRFTLVSADGACVGFARRRAGRGGRVLLDRRATPLDDLWRELPPAAAVEQQEEPSDSICYRSPKETWRDFTRSRYPWRRAFRRHLQRNPQLWREEVGPQGDVKGGLGGLGQKDVFDDVKFDLEDVKLDEDDVKMDIDPPCEVPRWGGKAHAFDVAARVALRKRTRARSGSGSGSDSSADDAPLDPREEAFHEFLTEVHDSWLHFRPVSPPPPSPSPPPPVPLPPGEPFAVELLPAPAPAGPFLTTTLTLQRLQGTHTTEEPPTLPSDCDSTMSVRVRPSTPPAIPRPRAPSPAPRAPPPATPPHVKLLAASVELKPPVKVATPQPTKPQSSPKKPQPAAGSEHKDKPPRSQEKVDRAAPSPVPNANIIVEEVNEVPPQIKIDKKKSGETLEEVVLAHGVQLKTVQTKHSPLKKHIISSRPAADAALAPHILTVAVSDTLKVRLQNHLVSTSSGVSAPNCTDAAAGGSGSLLGLVNTPFQPRARHQHTVASVAPAPTQTAVAVGGAGGTRRAPVVRPLQLAPPAHAAANNAPTHRVLAPSHTIHHVAPNKLKVLHAHPLHPLTHTQRNQLLGGRGSIAQLPAVVSLGGGQALIKGPNALTQFIEIKGAPLGKGPHLVNVVRQMAPHAALPPHAKPRAEPLDPKRRQLVFDANALKGNIQAVSRPHRVSVSVDARAQTAAPTASVASVRPPVRHQIQLKGRTLVGGAGGAQGAKTAALSQAVVANLLHKNVQLPKGGQKIAIGSAYGGAGVSVGGVGGVGGSVQALTLSGAQIKARAQRLHPSTHHIEVAESGASTSGSASGEESRRNNDTLPMEVT